MKAIDHIIDYASSDANDETIMFYAVILKMDIGILKKGTKFDCGELDDEFVLTLTNFDSDENPTEYNVQLVFMPIGIN